MNLTYGTCLRCRTGGVIWRYRTIPEHAEIGIHLDTDGRACIEGYDRHGQTVRCLPGCPWVKRAITPGWAPLDLCITCHDAERRREVEHVRAVEQLLNGEPSTTLDGDLIATY